MKEPVRELNHGVRVAFRERLGGIEGERVDAHEGKMSDEVVPRKDLQRLANILKSGDAPKNYLGVVLKNDFEFAGATESEATFIDKDGIRVIVMPGRWRCISPKGRSHEGTSISHLVELVDPQAARRLNSWEDSFHLRFLSRL